MKVSPRQIKTAVRNSVREVLKNPMPRGAVCSTGTKKDSDEETSSAKWYVGSEDAAIRHSIRHTTKRNIWVVVEGPDDDEFTSMPIKDAIENDFLYSWHTR